MKKDKLVYTVLSLITPIRLLSATREQGKPPSDSRARHARGHPTRGPRAGLGLGLALDLREDKAVRGVQLHGAHLEDRAGQPGLHHAAGAWQQSPQRGRQA